MAKRVWQIAENIFIVNVGSAKDRERYRYEHFHSKNSVFRGNLVHQMSLSKSQFDAVLEVLRDIGIEVKYLGER